MGLASDVADSAADGSRGRKPSRSLGWWLAPALVGVASTAALHLALRTFRMVAPPGLLPEAYRIQDWTSNWLMQTLGLEEMVPYGPRALVQNHIYPPLLDAIRYAFTWPETSAGQPFSAMAVDFRLYALYAVCFGMVNAVLFIWVRNLTRSGWWALGATLLWALVPGYIMTMTLLDPSPLAMLFITVSLYFLFMFLRERRLGWASGFFAMFLMASLSRSVTQAHVLLVLVVALVVFTVMAKRRQPLLVALNALLVGLMFVIPIKQYVMYATLDTTSFAGYHRVGMLGIDPRTVPQPEYPQHIVDNALAFSSRYNTQETIKDNYRLTAAANEFLVTRPLEVPGRLAQSLAITLPEIARPSSMYTQNYLVERLPWRGFLDWVFSGWRYGLMLIAAAIAISTIRGRAWVWMAIRRYGWFAVFYALLAAPILLSNRYRPGEEYLGPVWTDAIRQKVFLEVPIIVALAYAAWLVVDRLRAGRREG